MARTLPIALLLSAGFHGLVAAARFVPGETPPRPMLEASLRLPPVPAKVAAPLVPAPSASQKGEAPRPRLAEVSRPVLAVSAAVPAPASVAPPAAEAPPAALAAAQAAIPAPAAPAPTAPLEPPRFAAAYLANPPPPYPVSARRRGIEGEVRLEARISSSGHAQEVRVAASAGDASLDEAAQEAVRHWRFEPARRGSLAVEAWVSIPVVFRLN
ncbi:MAG TPA: energy transducer TonB [Rhodocyclaceae bacterium]|nr:energy transducer TonB [Rhodocyclaceae bacterium]